MLNPILELGERLRELPGIGPRQARRIAESLVRKNRAWVDAFSESLLNARRTVRHCPICTRMLFEGMGPCNLCRDPHRTDGELLIVEKDVDLEAIERSQKYHGRYFVLGGLISAPEAQPEKKIRIADLRRTLRNQRTAYEGGTLEVILALSATVEGEDTALYLREMLRQEKDMGDIRISELGRGLSTGSELEYADTATIAHALRGRG